MGLDKLEGININIITALSKSGWTVSRIATASPQQLAVIPGIGLKSAGDAIRAAQKIINTELLVISAKPETYQFIPDVPTQRSVRVRRIYGEKV